MSAQICIKSFVTGNTFVAAGDTADSAASIVSAHSSFWEAVTPVSSSICTTSFAYSTRVINRGDILLTSDAAVVAAPGYFVTADGSAKAVAIRQERLGTHR